MYLEKERALTFGTKDSDFLFDAMLASPTKVIHALRQVRFPEEVVILAMRPGHPDPVLLFDGARWKAPRLGSEVTISIGAPTSDYRIDLLIGTPAISFRDLWRRSKRARYFGVPIRIAAREDLLKLKAAADRPQDRFVLARLKAGKSRK